MTDILLAFLSGVSGGLAVYGAATLRLLLIKRKANQLTRVVKHIKEHPQLLDKLPSSRAKYRVVLAGGIDEDVVSAVYDGNDSQTAKRLFEEVKLPDGYHVKIFKNGVLRGYR